MRSFSLFELEPLAPADFRRWATAGVLLAAMAYTGVAIAVLLLRDSATLIPPWSAVAAAVACWTAFVLVLRGNARAGAALAALACWAEVHAAFLVTPSFPSVGLAVGPVLVMAATLLLGQRAGLVLTLISIIVTPWLLLESPSFDSGAFSVESAYWLGVHAVVMFAAWTLMSISLDTLRRVVELARAQEAEVAAMIASAPDGILILGDDDRVLHSNAAAARLLGVPEEPPMRDALAALLRRAGMKGDPASALRLVDPMEAPLLWSFTRDGDAPSVVEVTWRRIDARRRQLMLRDVTDRVRSEAAQRDNQAQVAHSQRLEAIGQLAGGIAHDFNNLLMAISGSAELAREEHDPEMRQTLLDEVLAAQERGASLTRQLLAFARRDVARPTVLDLSALVAQRQRLLQPIVGDRVKLVLDLEPDCRVRIDATQMEQALLNMVANSRDAMPNGGRCTISVHRLRSVLGPGEVRMTIADEGMGMDAETVSRAFEPFFTTKARGHGTGLGLASVQGTVLSSGGTVAIESEVGLGTRVLITLPYADAPLEDAEAATRTREPRTGGGATILVVDDDDSTRTVVARILQRAGHRVVLAPDGLQAIRVIMADSEIDMLVSDVTMPGLTGPELADAVQSRLPGLPMLFISGYPRDAVTSESGLRGEHHLITKPFTARELTERVAERLAAARTR